MDGEELPPHGGIGKAELDVALDTTKQQSVEGHLLDRLRGGSVELATDVKPLGVGTDFVTKLELDSGVD